jgi:hypothetical protein
VVSTAGNFGFADAGTLDKTMPPAFAEMII